MLIEQKVLNRVFEVSYCVRLFVYRNNFIGQINSIIMLHLLSNGPIDNKNGYNHDYDVDDDDKDDRKAAAFISDLSIIDIVCRIYSTFNKLHANGILAIQLDCYGHIIILSISVLPGSSNKFLI